MQARHCIRLASLGATALLLAAGPAAAVPVPIDATMAHTFAQQGALSEDGRVIQVQKRGDGGLKPPGGGGNGGGRGDGGGNLRIGGGDGGGGGGGHRGGRGGGGNRDYSLSQRGDGDHYRRRGHGGRRHRGYGPRYDYSVPFFYGYPYYGYPYSYGYAYPSGRCAYWHRRCVANWGYGNSNYYGCMRYYGCR